jgi:hypothetical protein
MTNALRRENGRSAPRIARVRDPIAVIAETLAAARAAARRLAGSAALAPLTAWTPASYLRREAAPSRVVLCAPGDGAESAAAFLRDCAARLLWPPPPADLHHAIEGIRAEMRAPPGPRRRPAPARRRFSSARLLEGRVDRRRAAAALGAGRPLDWIVESPRHVRLTSEELDALAASGVRWSALDPVELVGVYGPASLGRTRRAWSAGFPKGVTVWRAET